MRSPIEQFYLDNYDKLLLSATKMARKKYIAKDVMQQLYLNLRNLGQDRLTAIEHPKNYLYFSIRSIIMNYNRDKVKKSDREVAFQVPREFGQECTDEAYKCIDQAYRLDLIAEFANTLPKKQKKVFISLLQGKSGKETAAEYGNKYNSIKHNRRLIVEKLREFFNNKGEEFDYGI